MTEDRPDRPDADSPEGQSTDRLKPPPEDQSTVTAFPDTGDPQRIGPYRLLQKLGEGGMGEVWEAEQTEPVKRRVALKLIKHGMDTKRVVARFEAERQALAMMDHPNVAKVFEAGSTLRGRPYFAMEYVQGVPINEHCDRHTLTNRERLELFLQVCEGVQHAHQKAIIHRDLKPSNALVSIQDGKAVPKIIDFGVAKAISQKLTERTLFTEQGQLVGTPEYMSPEQAEMTGQNVDTRTDVYSLGVMLYELLVGALPIDPKELRQAGFRGIAQKIREEESPKPSTRLSTLGERSTESARRRRVDVPTLQRQLRGDLDWITMKALEKNRTRRYGSPQELAADIGRHLQDQPVLAGPPSTAYRAKKFVRRHKVGVGVAAAGLVVLIGFAGAMAYQTNRIARERDRANREAESSERVAVFLANMLGEVEPEAMGQLLVTDLQERIETAQRARGATDEEVEGVLASFGNAMRDVNATDAGLRLLDELVLARAGNTIEQQLGEEPRIAARLEHTIGSTYDELGLYAQAEPHTLRAVEIRERVLGDDHPDTLDSMNILAILYWNQGRYDEAEPLYRETLETKKRVLGDDHPSTLGSMNNLAILYDMQGRYDEAEPLHLETLDTQRRMLGDDHPNTLLSMNNLALLYREQGRYEEAEALRLETLETQKRVLGDDHQDTVQSINNLAALYQLQGRYDEAEPLFLETLENQKRVLGDDHPNTLDSMTKLAVLYGSQGRYDEAEPLYLEALETQKRVLRDDHPNTLLSMNNLAILYESQGRYDEAEPLFLQTLETRKRVLGDTHPSTLNSMGNLAHLYTSQGRYDEAESLYLKALETQKRVLRDDHPDTLDSMNNLAVLYRNQGRYDEAEPLYIETLETRKRVLGDVHPSTLTSMNDLGNLYNGEGRYDEAEPLYLKTLEIRKDVLGDDHPDTLRSMNTLANLYNGQGLPDRARPFVAELLTLHRRKAEEKKTDAAAKNEYAWLALTCEPSDLQDSWSALRFALEANELTGFENAGLLDTLALAYHRTDQTSKAIKTQRKALGLLPEDDTRNRADFERRLAEFEASSRNVDD